MKLQYPGKLMWMCSENSIQNNKSRLHPLTILLFLLMLSTQASAGGLEFPGIGTQGAARGGAFVAKADDGTAFLYNPAGLAKSDAKDLLLSVQLVNLQLGFHRSGTGGYWLHTPGQNWSANCPPQQICIADPAMDFSSSVLGQPFSKVSMSKTSPLPIAIFTWGNFAKVDGLSISAGLAPPAGFAAFSLPATGPQRYTLVESAHFMIFPGVGAAYRINQYLHIGAVFMSGIAHLNQSLKIRPLPSLASTSVNEHSGGDATLKITALDPFVPTAIFGVLSTLTPWLEVGVSVKLPAMIFAEGTMEYEAPTSDMANSTMPSSHNSVNLKQHFPLKVSVGARFIANRFDIEADLVFENWESLAGFDVQPQAVIRDPIDESVSVDTPLPHSQIRKDYRNTYCVRLGSTIALIRNVLQVHLGSFYQSSAYPKNNNTFNLDVPFATQIGIAGGISLSLGNKLDLHMSYLRIFQPDITVTKGIVQQQGLPLSSGENIGNTVNSGTYEVALNIFGISGEIHFY